MGNKTGKLIIRVLYISFAVIILVFSSIIFFNTAKGDHILNLTNQYLTDKNYDGLQTLFGGIYYNEPSVKIEGKNGTLLVSASGAEKDVLYYPDENEKAHLYHNFDRAYNFYIFDSNFASSTASVNGVKKNDTGVKFITDKLDESGNAVTYTYYFVVSSTINSDLFSEKHTSLNDYFLNFTRDYVSDKSRYGFFNFQLNEETVKAIKAKTGGNITSFNITNNEGKNVFDKDIQFTFAFDEKFYDDNQAGVVFNAYREYLPYYDSYKFGSKYTVDRYIETTNSVYNAKTETFNNIVNKFNADLKAGNVYDSNIKVSLLENEIMTSDVIAGAVWRTIGIEALILLVVVVIYILLFHFQQLRDFIFRNEKRTPIRAKVVNKEPEEKQNSFKYNQTGNKKNEQAKLEKPVEEKTVEEAQSPKAEVNTTEESKEDSTEESKNE